MIEKDKLTYDIIGCAMKVHNKLGNGFQEVIYQRCLAIELNRSGIEHQREKEHTIYYDTFEVGTRRADFVVENKVIVELKALVNLEDVHLAQAKNYVVAYDFPLGLLINFGSQSLQYKLIFNLKYFPKKSESGFVKLNNEQNTFRKFSNPENPDSDK
jgi:GxxExxY protein